RISTPTAAAMSPPKAVPVDASSASPLAGSVSPSADPSSESPGMGVPGAGSSSSPGAGGVGEASDVSTCGLSTAQYHPPAGAERCQDTVMLVAPSGTATVVETRS